MGPLSPMSEQRFMFRHPPAARPALLAAAALAIVGALCCTTSSQAADGDVAVNLVNISDFHGRIDTNTVKFAGTIEQLRAAYGDANSLFLSAGDNIGATLFASASADEQPTIDVLNALQVSASSVGNHEFDQGFGFLSGTVLGGANGYRPAQFPYLGANVYLKGTTTPARCRSTSFSTSRASRSASSAQMTLETRRWSAGRHRHARLR